MMHKNELTLGLNKRLCPSHYGGHVNHDGFFSADLEQSCGSSPEPTLFWFACVICLHVRRASVRYAAQNWVGRIKRLSPVISNRDSAQLENKVISG